MVFRVDISPSALNDAEAAYLWLQKDSPSYADEWFNGLLNAIDSLETFPNRCPLAPESKDLGLEIRQLRQLLHQKYRVLFIVVPNGGTVIASLTPETGIPTLSLAKQLRLFESLTQPNWGVLFKTAPRELHATDGELITKLVIEASQK